MHLLRPPFGFCAEGMLRLRLSEALRSIRIFGNEIEIRHTRLISIIQINTILSTLRSLAIWSLPPIHESRRATILSTSHRALSLQHLDRLRIPYQLLCTSDSRGRGTAHTLWRRRKRRIRALLQFALVARQPQKRNASDLTKQLTFKYEFHLAGVMASTAACFRLCERLSNAASNAGWTTSEQKSPKAPRTSSERGFRSALAIKTLGTSPPILQDH